MLEEFRHCRRVSDVKRILADLKENPHKNGGRESRDPDMRVADQLFGSTGMDAFPKMWVLSSDDYEATTHN